MASKQKLIDNVMALPETDRVEVIQQILSSLQPGVDDLDDDQFEEELDRRAAELKANPSAGVPWTKIKKLR